MQSDVHLQRSLIEEVEKELEGYTSINNDGEYLHFNVYPQNLPAKQAKNDDSHFPYVLVCLDEEEIEDEDSENLVTVYFQVGILDKNPNKQGHFDVANVMNRLTKRFLENRVVNKSYRNNYPLIKKFKEDETCQKFIVGMSTIWTVAAPKIKETEYD